MVLTPNDVGILVEHPVWQRGKVIEINSPYAIIHFPSLANSPQGPQRKLREDAPQLTKSSVQSDPELDGIETGPAKPKKVTKRKARDLQNDLDAAVQWFEQTYPARFEDDKLRDADYRNKRAAQETFAANFADGRGAAMVESGQHAQVALLFDGIYRSTNILSPFEMKAVHKAFAKGDESATKVLSTTLAFVANPGMQSFKNMAEAVSQLPADGGKVNTWPIVTLLPMFADPARFIALKPTNTELIAARMQFNMKYDSTPNWETYDATLRMASQLMQRLAPLGAKDMIDVQAFMWVTRDLS
ncbi:MAG TPA: hypothetical protein VEC39_07135 [Vicinamibacterales bacterium]|nr:hypothetical protein [Vicinamibacterales bacterium]